jgi:hypothetical protein
MARNWRELEVRQFPDPIGKGMNWRTLEYGTYWRKLEQEKSRSRPKTGKGAIPPLGVGWDSAPP